MTRQKRGKKGAKIAATAEKKFFRRQTQIALVSQADVLLYNQAEFKKTLH